MIGDPLFLECLAAIGTACILSYLLGRWHGIASAHPAEDEQLWGDVRRLPERMSSHGRSINP